MSTRRDVEFIVGKIISGFSVTEADEIPKIDLYMDQVLQFLSERLRRTVRKSEAGAARKRAVPTQSSGSDMRRSGRFAPCCFRYSSTVMPASFARAIAAAVSSGVPVKWA